VINDLLDFCREHRALTACFIVMLLFAYLSLTVNGLASFAYLLVFVMAFIWFVTLCCLSLWSNYETSKAWRDRVRPGVARSGMPRQGKASHGEPRLGKPRYGMAWRAQARLGRARRGWPRRGGLRPGTAWRGKASRGTPRHGVTRPGMAERGVVSQGTEDKDQ
jgi:hypothetical protein